ncbi:hypothetical protein, partial [Actinocrispum sp. NPDC049592]|uniref:hypothetical protein n=1 Tax=Actinocrispum sp. NPDC049592 TaxID=3154835 RepID=UPI003425616F
AQPTGRLGITIVQPVTDSIGFDVREADVHRGQIRAEQAGDAGRSPSSDPPDLDDPSLSAPFRGTGADIAIHSGPGRSFRIPRSSITCRNVHFLSGQYT